MLTCGGRKTVLCRPQASVCQTPTQYEILPIERPIQCCRGFNEIDSSCSVAFIVLQGQAITSVGTDALTREQSSRLETKISLVKKTSPIFKSRKLSLKI